MRGHRSGSHVPWALLAQGRVELGSPASSVAAALTAPSRSTGLALPGSEGHDELAGKIWYSERTVMLILMCVLISKKWSPASNYWRGLILLWITRIGVILCLQQQLADAPAELQSMATHVAVVCTGGWMFYSFIEYFLFALSLSIIRPLRLGFSPIPAESIYETLYRHVLILALGVSIAWTVHADQRRDWLRSRSHADEVVHPRRSKTSKPARRDTQQRRRERKIWTWMASVNVVFSPPST